MKKLFAIVVFILTLGLSTPTVCQTWASFIDGSRAVAWSGHTGFTIPRYTVNCSTQPSLSAGIGNSAANASSLVASLASCDSTHNVVNIPAGTWYVNGFAFASHGQEVLRGAGPNQTTLLMQTEVGCGGSPSGICMVPGTWYYSGNSNVLPPSGTRQCLWTAGYAQGSTSLTLNNCPGGVPAVGQIIVLDQANDSSDNGGLYLCDSFTFATTSGAAACSIDDWLATRSITNISSSAGTATVVASGSLAASAGSVIIITGTTNYNGTFTLTSANNSTFTYKFVHSNVSTETSGTSYISGETNAAGRPIGGATYSEKQVSTILSVTGSGTGPYTVTIAAPGVYFTNIRAGQNPGAWFPGLVTNDGVENLAIDGTAIADTNLQMVACYQCWIANVASNNAGRAHMLDYLSYQDTIRDSYVYQNQNHAASSYGIELEQTSDSLVENNICQQQTVCVMEGNSTGSVIGYNFSVGTTYVNTNYLLPQFSSHNAGNGLNLWEGNMWPNTATDDTWGSSIPKTFFRNFQPGYQHQASGPIYYTQPFLDRSYSRANNVVGNVFGQAGYHTVYESYATSSIAGVNGTTLATSIYSLGWGSFAESSAGTCTSPPGIGNTACDPLVRSTLMRWGNYDTVTAGVKWDSTEASPSAVTYVNANFTSTYFNGLAHTLPASLYYNSAPSWWTTGKNWPPVGPDVSNGNVGVCTGTYVNSPATSAGQCSGGTLSTAWAAHVTSIPAMDCYLTIMGGAPDGSGSMLSFNASTCYSSIVPPAQIAPSGFFFADLTIGDIIE